jgi:hypothetical protein
MSRGRPGISKGGKRHGLGLVPLRVREVVEGFETPITRLMPAPVDAETHWKCPDCFEPCRCTDPAARSMPHERCGRPKKRGMMQ